MRSTLGWTIVVHPLEEDGQAHHHGCGKQEIQSQGKVIGRLQGSHPKLDDPKGNDASYGYGDKYDGITTTIADHDEYDREYEGKQKTKDSERLLIPPSGYTPGCRSGPIDLKLQTTRR